MTNNLHPCIGKAMADALMDMVNQFFREGPDGLRYHSFMSAEEAAIDVLVVVGLAVKRNNGYELLWDRLNGWSCADLCTACAGRSPAGGGYRGVRAMPFAGLPSAGQPESCDEVDAAHWGLEELA